LASEWLLAGVRTEVLLEGALLVPTFPATFVLAHKGLLPSVNPGMNEKVSRTKETLSTAGKSASVRFRTLVVASAMIHKISFGTKFPRTSSNVAFECLFLLHKGVGVYLLVPKLGNRCGRKNIEGHVVRVVQIIIAIQYRTGNGTITSLFFLSLS